MNKRVNGKKMKRISHVGVLLLLVIFSASLSFLKAKDDRVVFEFKYNRLARLASNQYALWIEDSQGRFVTTVFVTSFTAEKGYATREDSLPLWRKQSNWKKVRGDRLDVVSGATPRSGTQRIVWDLMDREGKKVAPGVYTYKLEANVHWDKRILYRGTLRVDGKPFSGTAELTDRSEDIAEREMLIQNLKVRCTP